MVSRRNQSSQVKAFPAMKHARTLLTVVSFRVQEDAANAGRAEPEAPPDYALFASRLRRRGVSAASGSGREQDGI